MKRFTNHPEPWGTFVDIKHWPEIKHPEKYAGKELFIGSVCDPYQPLEETACRTRALLEQMQGTGCSLSIATKSDLVLRDLDLIKTFPNARVSWSINTLDEDFRTDMDNAVSIERRLAAMKAFHDAGVRTTCFISPIFPGITDLPAIIRRAKDQCNLVWLENLNLRAVIRKRFLTISRTNIQTCCRCTMPFITKKTAATGQCWMRRCGSSVRKKSCCMSVMMIPSNARSTIRPSWLTTFFHEEIIPSAKKKAAKKSNNAKK